MENLKRNIKKKILVWILAIALVFGGTICYTDILVKADTTVYITKTGSKYHGYACGNGTYYKATLSEAKAKGLTPCSKCADGISSGNSSSSTKNKVKPIKINKTSILLVKDQSTKLKISNATKKIKWKSTKTSVATVSSNGLIVAKKKGKTVIIVQVGNQQKKCNVTVEEPKMKKEVAMTVGTTKNLKLSGCKHSIKWSSSDSTVVKVKKGEIIAQDVGTEKIKAKVHGKTFVCRVTVKE